MEKATWVNSLDQALNLSKGGISRIYFGNEFCEKLIPALSQAHRLFDFIKNNNFKLTFLTPWCSDAGLAKLKAIFELIPRGTEIVFNDFGVLKKIKDCKEKVFNPVLGRLLVKYKRDPRIGSLKATNRQRDYFMSSNINNKAFQHLLLESGIRRVEIENTFQGYNFKLDKGIRASLYYPYAYLTTTTRCIFKEKLNSPDCSFACKDQIIVSKVKGLAVDIITKGNSEFYSNAKIPGERILRERNVDRIVYFAALPY